MNKSARFLFYATILVTVARYATISAAAEGIGVASAVVHQVTGSYGGRSHALAVGNAVFSNERIRTSDASSAQLLLLDKTSLSIGPHAELALDRFVYNPDRSTGRVVVNATKGAFRFITGSQIRRTTRSRPRSLRWEFAAPFSTFLFPATPSPDTRSPSS